MHLVLADNSEWESKLGTNSKSTFITSIKKTLAPAVNLPLMCDFVTPLYRNSGATFYWIIWRHHRTPSLIPPPRETVNVWLVVGVCVDVWCSSIGSAPHATVTWKARLGRESEKTGHLWPAVLPAHSASCDCGGEALAADSLTATVSAAICGRQSGPQVTRATFSWSSEGRWRKVPDKVISERSSLVILPVEESKIRHPGSSVGIQSLKTWNDLFPPAEFLEPQTMTTSWPPLPVKPTKCLDRML